MREVDDAGDAEDEREPGRDEEEDHRVREPREELDEEERQAQVPLRSFFTSSSEGSTFSPGTYS